jgi:putative Holliday junction resolvase
VDPQGEAAAAASVDRPGRVLGVDVGHVRVGLAISDPDRLVATPLDTIPGGADLAGRLATRAEEESCHTVVIGLPLGLSGRDTDSTRMARAVAEELSRRQLDIQLHDERLTSAEADRAMRGTGRSREQRRAERDRVAATIILQGWLESWRGRQEQ